MRVSNVPQWSPAHIVVEKPFPFLTWKLPDISLQAAQGYGFELGDTNLVDKKGEADATAEKFI